MAYSRLVIGWMPMAKGSRSTHCGGPSSAKPSARPIRAGPLAQLANRGRQVRGAWRSAVGGDMARMEDMQRSFPYHTTYNSMTRRRRGRYMPGGLFGWSHGWREGRQDTEGILVRKGGIATF